MTSTRTILTVLVVFALGGIPLSRADSLFGFLTSDVGLLSPTLGGNPQTTCSFIYSGPVNTLRTEAFLVTGHNDLNYVASNEIAESLVP